MATKKPFKIIPIFLALTLLSVCPMASPGAGALAQDSRMRLARPGSDVVLPSGQRRFNLGVEHQYQVPLESSAQSANGVDDFNGQRASGLTDPQERTVLNSSVMRQKFPELEIPLNRAERPIPTLPVKPNSSVKVLANYDVELIVDQSMSMLTPDCPGASTRWNWCGDQAHELANQLQPFVPKGLTITAFAKHFDVHPNASAQNIADLFGNPNFGIGTRLSDPLADRLDSYFARRKPGSKPVLIAVITDGVPTPKHSEPQMVVDTIVNASRRVGKQGEVTIVFFQIGGGDRKGRAFLDHLDNSLLAEGARYDIVRTVPFDQLEQVGLARALVDSVQTFAGRVH